MIIKLMTDNIPKIKIDPVKTDENKFNWKRVVFLVVGGTAIIFAGLSSYYYLQLSGTADTPDIQIPRETTSSAQKDKKSNNESKLTNVKAGNLAFTFGHPNNWHVYIDTTPNENKETHIWLDETPIFISASGRPPGKIIIMDRLILEEDSTLFGFKDVNGALVESKKKYTNPKQDTFNVDGVAVYKLSGEQKLSEIVGGGSANAIEFLLGFRSDSSPTVDHVISFSVAGLSSQTPRKDFEILEKIVKSIKFIRIIR